MTLPDERYRAVRFAEQFLQRLAGGEYPRVPRAVREEARMILRHYPGSYYMEELARRSPDIITPKMEELHRFIKQGEQAKDN